MKLFNKISVVNLVLIVSLFLTISGNYKFFSETIVVYPINGNLFFLISLVFWLSSFLAICLLLFSYRHTVKPILILLLITSSAVSYFANTYGTIIDDNMIANTVETNMSESADLLSWNLAIYVLLLGIVPSIWIYKIKLEDFTLFNQLLSKLKALVLLIIVFVLITLTFSKSYTSFARENRDLRLYINPTYFVYAVGKYINMQFENAKVEFKIVGDDAKIVRKDSKKKLLIVVIGETARADRFSLNGYKKQTNELLEREKVVNFNNMYSCGTDTAFSVPCMFSLLTRDEYSHAEGKNMSNVLDVMSKAGVEISWRENNSSSKSVADRVDYVNYQIPENNPNCEDECRDEGMIANLQEYIDTKKGSDIVVVLHTMGSHGPAYYKRYPKSFEKYTPVCETNQLNECSDEQINNAYDNTIVYTDYVLSKTIELLKNNTENYKTAMIYVSDHGESLGENGIYLHGMPYFIAPKEQIHVGSVLWFDENFSKDIDMIKLNKISKQHLSHDSLVHIMMGLMNVKTSVYDKSLDFIPYAK